VSNAEVHPGPGKIPADVLRGNTTPSIMQQYDVVRGVKQRLDTPRNAGMLYMELTPELVAQIVSDAVAEMEQALVTIAMLAGPGNAMNIGV